MSASNRIAAFEKVFFRNFNISPIIQMGFDEKYSITMHNGCSRLAGAIINENDREEARKKFHALSNLYKDVTGKELTSAMARMSPTQRHHYNQFYILTKDKELMRTPRDHAEVFAAKIYGHDVVRNLTDIDLAKKIRENKEIVNIPDGVVKFMKEIFTAEKAKSSAAPASPPMSLEEAIEQLSQKYKPANSDMTNEQVADYYTNLTYHKDKSILPALSAFLKSRMGHSA